MRAIKYTPGTANHPTGIIELQPPEKNSAIAALYLDNEEARLLMRRIAEALGHDPQARQDIAATATLHGMGYRWSDTNQWWQPPKEERKQLAEVQQRANTEMTGIILKTHEALGVEEPYDADGTGIVPAIKALKSTLDQVYTATGVEPGHPDLILTINQTKEMHERVMRCFFDTCSTLGIGNSTENCGKVVPAIEALQRRAHEQDQALTGICSALGMSIKPYYSTDIVVYVRSQRDILAGVYEIMGVTPSACNLGPAIRDMKARETALALDNAGAFAALRDHGYTPDRGETLGTLIRDAFGAESLKLSALIRDRDAKWAMGRIAGVQQERSRCYNIIDRAIAANTPSLNASDSIFHSMQGAQHALLQVRKEITDPT